MKLIEYLKKKVPFELKRKTSIISIILALIFSGVLSRVGQLIVDLSLSALKKLDFAKVWNILIWVTSFSFEINLIGLIIFVIILFPVYRRFDKFLLTRFGTKVVFEDDFESGNKGWELNYWTINTPKTNRIENSAMIFEANENELMDPRKEFGAFIDLRNGIYRDYKYEVSCSVRSEENTTMQFRLWLHDSIGGASSINTPWIIPPVSGEVIKLDFVANSTEAIRIHLHIKAGEGIIIVNEVFVRKI